MNRYILIRRLKGPAVLLLLGIVALLHQADLVSWKLFVPLLLILLGVLQLAERMSLATETEYPPAPYPGAPYPGVPYAGAVNPAAGPVVTQPGTSIVPAHDDEFERDKNGGQS
jgi:hypothetical protein